ncbi:amino acid adenylation domain-containing protein [Corallococcus sp. M34]|uniref:non-ribosomal peptide synthetase n=1 Tax=Citreicoccus inhibens TaxID=2849499 RepID=UPI001C210349|nr:amino acid adenylation domain-containing protein [Citreicoccus inhibens]MBU8895262.1 amino acid adenylation domain-containing protein [Citreicoccus inhibens]
MPSPLVLRLPETSQVVFGHTVLNQPELLRRATLIAERLRTDFGVVAGDRVGLMTVPGPDVVPALLGIWMAGAAYVPLDPFLPDERLLRIVRDAGLRGIVTQREHRITLGLLESWLGGALPSFAVDAEEEFSQAPARAPSADLEVPPERPAYLIYTSGSTGEPKGVVCTFQGVHNLIQAARPIMALGSATRHLQFASINFDASVWELFPTLFWGGTVVQGSREELLPGRRLAHALHHHRVTHVCLPPSVLGQLGPFVDALPDLTDVIMAGERCPPPLADRWHVSGRRVFNAYGPTETTVCATMYRVRGDEAPVPIGTPLPGVRLRVMHAGGEEARPGQTGELWIGGAGVAAGYRNQPDKTREAFPRDAAGDVWYRTGDEVVYRDDGELVFLGRLDHQVKLRGFRIELEAIEQALYAFPGVAQAAVKVFEETDAQGQVSGELVAYYAVHEGAAVSRDALRAQVSAVLPDYMVPHHFQSLPRLPLMPNLGKVDRQALPPPRDWKRADAARPPSTASTPMERLCRVFEQTLRAAPGTFTESTHFFHAGGDSLGVARVLARVEEEFGVSLPSRQLYSHPTPAALLPFCATDGGALPQPDSVRDTLLADAASVPSLRLNARGTQDARPPRAVLLTGATGFLGIHLLAALASRVERVYCLVRARDTAEAQARVRATAARYAVTLPWSEDRIRAVPGDITRESLGMEPLLHDTLARACDAVVHAAANISYILPYADAGRPNVAGTQNVLAFTAYGRLKALHHVSSLSVYGALGTLKDRQVVPEDFDLDESLDLMRYENGYTRAKWVAERLVTAARAAGMPVSIYRPGFIEGHSRTGIGNADDLLCRLLVGNIQMGIYPDFPQKYWLPVPVDYVATAMAHLVVNQPPGGNYNLVAERSQEPSHNEIFERLGGKGHPLFRVQPHVWLRELTRLGPDNALFPLVGFMREKVYHGTRTLLELHYRSPIADTTNTRAALAGSGIQCPDIDEALLRRYRTHLLQRHRHAVRAA